MGCSPLQAAGLGELAGRLPRSLGWSMGTEIRESHYQLTAKCSAPIQPGMIFNVSLGARRPRGPPFTGDCVQTHCHECHAPRW